MQLLKEVPYQGLLGVAPVAPLDKRESSVLLSATLQETSRGTGQLSTAAQDAFDKNRVCEVIVKRWLRVGIQPDQVANPEVIMVVAVLRASDRFGVWVMWSYTLLYLRASFGCRLTLRHLVEAFPIGFPTSDACNEAWDAQKGRHNGIECDNCLDLPDWWLALKNLL